MKKSYSNYCIFTSGFALECVDFKPKKKLTTHFKLDVLSPNNQ